MESGDQSSIAQLADRNSCAGSCEWMRWLITCPLNGFSTMRRHHVEWSGLECSAPPNGGLPLNHVNGIKQLNRRQRSKPPRR